MTGLVYKNLPTVKVVVNRSTWSTVDFVQGCRLFRCGVARAYHIFSSSRRISTPFYHFSGFFYILSHDFQRLQQQCVERSVNYFLYSPIKVAVKLKILLYSNSLYHVALVSLGFFDPFKVFTKLTQFEQKKQSDKSIEL